MDSKHIVNLSGKDFVLYAGLLAEAHERGLQSIETQLVQIPAEENGNTAIARAVVRLKDGTFFEEYGDANARNVNPRIATALIRMALTRAKGRALRDAVNVGVTMAEELADMEDATPVTPHAHHRQATAARPAPRTADPGPDPGTRAGFEAEYTHEGKPYKREEMLKYARLVMTQARDLALEHNVEDPGALPNAELYTFGRGMKARVAAARGAALQAKAEAVG